MTDLERLRQRINTIDAEIMTLLDARFDLVKQIGKIKDKISKNIEDKSRETAIIEQINGFTYNEEIQSIYQALFKVSKNLQRK